MPQGLLGPWPFQILRMYGWETSTLFPHAPPGLHSRWTLGPYESPQQEVAWEAEWGMWHLHTQMTSRVKRHARHVQPVAGLEWLGPSGTTEAVQPARHLLRCDSPVSSAGVPTGKERTGPVAISEQRPCEHRARAWLRGEPGTPKDQGTRICR